MAKVQANTISTATYSRRNAPYASPASHAGTVASALAAGAKPYDVMNDNIARLAKQKINNIQSRDRELRDAMAGASKGVNAAILGIDAAMQRRADEQAEVQLAKYTEYLLANKEEDFSRPVKGDLAAKIGDGEDSKSIDGPYTAVTQRMAEWNDMDEYTGMSARTRDAFEKKRQTIDQRWRKEAIVAHSAGQMAIRDANNQLVVEKKTELAINAMCDVKNVGTESMALDFDDAANYETSVWAKKNKLWDGYDTYAEGAKELIAAHRQATTDAAYLTGFQKLAETIANSDDPGERQILGSRMLALVAAKSGNIDEDTEEGKALARAAKNYSFSDSVAKQGFEMLKKANDIVQKRMEAQKKAAESQYKQAVAKFSLNNLTDSDGNLVDKASFEKYCAAVEAQFPDKTDELREYKQKYYDALDLHRFESDFNECLRRNNPGESIAAMAAALDKSDPLYSRKQKILGSWGVPPDKREMLDENQMALNLSLCKTDEERVEKLWDMYRSGKIDQNTYNESKRLVAMGDLNGFDWKTTLDAFRQAGFYNLDTAMVTQDGTPVLDGRGRVQFKKGFDNVLLIGGKKTVTRNSYSGAFAGGVSYTTEVFDGEQNVATDLMANMLYAAVKYQKMRDEDKRMLPLSEFLKTQLVGDVRKLEAAELESKAWEWANELFGTKKAARFYPGGKIYGTGR